MQTVSKVQLDPKVKEAVDVILEAQLHRSSNIISILQGVQRLYRYVPEDVMMYVAEDLHMSPAKVYGIATFYENFSLEPKGKYVIKLCDGTACHVRKSTPILMALRAKLGLSEQKHTTDDMIFTLEVVSCLGACGLSPVLMVNEVVHAAMTPDKATALIDTLMEGEKHD